jgi:hypothetical protein
MHELRVTLLADGPSDRALLPILLWLLAEHGVRHAIQAILADPGRVNQRVRTLEERIPRAISLYPCDLLFVHRDAEREPHARRHHEIRVALAQVRQAGYALPAAVCVVPVRMHEAWLLFDEAAIRMASGNPNGRAPLELPRFATIEGLPDPKETLSQIIRAASGLRGRRLQQLKVSTQRVADGIEDFSPLRALPAFQTLEAEVHQVVEAQGWNRADAPA